MATIEELAELAEQVEEFSGELRDGEDTIGAVLRSNRIGGDRARSVRRALNVLLFDRMVERNEGERKRRIDAIHDSSTGWLNR